MERIFRKNDDIVFRKIIDQSILVPIKNNVADMHRLYMLNVVGEYIWQNLDGKCSLGKICDGIAVNFIVEPQDAEQDAIEFIENLLEFDLIQEV